MPIFAIVDDERRIVVCTTNVREVLPLADRAEGWVRTYELAGEFTTALTEAAAYGLRNLERVANCLPQYRRAKSI